MPRLSNAVVRDLPVPEKGNRVHYDSSKKSVRGFGARITAAGHRAFILNYVNSSGRERRYTIGDFGDWNTTDARIEAQRLRHLIDEGGDPLADKKEKRDAPTIADLVERFREEHFPRLRESSREDYERMLRCHVVPHLGEHTKVQDITFDEVDALHRKMTRRGHRHRANRTLAVLSKAYALAIKWKWCESNPCKGIERNREHHRQRYMTDDELTALTKALAIFPDRQVANIIRLLLLTGARRGEVLSMRWRDLDLGTGTWAKPPTSTKQDRHHSVPLSGPARALLAEIEKQTGTGTFVFPSDSRTGHVVNITRAWQRLRKSANLRDLRLHDLRHSYASALVSTGHNLPLVASLLGHSSVSMAERYSHLYADPLRRATEQVGAIVTAAAAGQPPKPPTPIRRGRRP